MLEKYNLAGIEPYMMAKVEGKVLNTIRDGEEHLTIQIGVQGPQVQGMQGLRGPSLVHMQVSRCTSRIGAVS